MDGAPPADVSRHRFTGLGVDLVLAGAVALAVVAGVWAELAAWTGPLTGLAGVLPWGAYVLGIAASAALLVRRAHPLLCVIIVLLLVAGYHFAGYPGGAPALALFVALYSLASGARAVWQIAVAIVVVGVWAVIPALPPNSLPWDSYATLGPALAMIWIVVLGIAARQVGLANQRSVRVAEAEAEARLRERIAADRLGIARELHDVLAHTVSVISVQAAAAVDAFDSDPEAARQSMIRVRSLAKQAMPELRRTLSLLRSAEDGSGRDEGRDESTSVRGEAAGRDEPTTPQPQLADLPRLIAAARGPKLEVALSDVTDHACFGPLLELTLYRIVQESLTNIMRHSDGTRANVSLDVEDGTLRLAISDNGGAAVGNPAPGTGTPLSATGFGIRGMRERAEVLGGTLRTEREGAGFTVVAEFPLESRDTSTAFPVDRSAQ